jgi:hypothetical protein
MMIAPPRDRIPFSQFAAMAARRFGLAAFAAALCLAASTVQVQTWNGSTTDWNTATNWTPNTVPTGTATFCNTGGKWTSCSRRATARRWSR